MPQIQRRSQRGFSLIELLIVVAIILILAAIAIPKLNQNRMFAQEAAAVGNIQTLHKGLAQYYSQFGKFPTSLAELGPPASGQAGPTGADLIPGDLAQTGKRNGYIFTLQQVPMGYAINANPEIYGSTGRRTFYSDQTMVIHQNWGSEPATPTSPEFK